MVTKTEEFASRCCAEYHSVPVDEVRAKVDAGAISWVVWLELVITVIQSVIENCPQRARLAGIALSGPSRWQRIRFRRLTYQAAECCGYEIHKQDAGDIANCVMDCAAKEQETTLTDIVNEVSDPDNWLF